MIKKIFSIILCVIVIIPSCITTSASVYSESGIISLMAELGIMNGDPDGNLRLDDNLSRAEFSKMVVNASSYKNLVALNQPTSTFKDVNYTHWAAPYIRVGVNKGILSGYPDASFKPSNPVLFEEALSICLKLLGYTTEDYGTAWPWGQIGLSENIGLSDNVSVGAGTAITRRDAINIIYNMLTSYPKGSGNYFMSNINYALKEDVILIATNNEDTSVGSDKIYTSDGMYKMTEDFDTSNIGRRGTLIIKNNDYAAGFIPSDQLCATYNLYQILDGNIMVSQNGNITALNVGSDLTVYYKSEKHTLSSLADKVNTGDVITVFKNTRGVYDYGIVAGNNLAGPYTVRTEQWLEGIGMDNTASIIRNGSKASVTSVQRNDVIYYSKSLNTIWAYSKKVTGVYESAYPTKDNPTSVTVSGVTYQIEGSGAFTALSSNGSYNIGDTVTLLIGRDGTSVADVLSSSASSSSVVYGYLIDTGTKEYSSADGSTYSSYYVKIVDVDGNELEYPVKSNYSSYKNSVISVAIKSSGVMVSLKNSDYDITGKVSAENMTIGKYKMASDISIIDVADSDNYETSVYKKVYPQTIDGMNFYSKSVLYCSKNSIGEIDGLILKNVTGEVYEYGIIVSNSDNGRSYSYTYDISGTRNTINTSTKYSVYSGNAVKIIRSGNSIQSMMALYKTDRIATSISLTELTAGNDTYKISPSVAVYTKSGINNYMSTSLEHIVNNADDYQISAYYDKTPSSGGKVRVIVATKK